MNFYSFIMTIFVAHLDLSFRIAQHTLEILLKLEKF